VLPAGKKITFNDALGTSTILVTGLPIVFWFVSWAKPHPAEIAGIIAVSGVLHVAMMHVAFRMHESRSPVRRYLREFRETGKIPEALEGMDPVSVRSSLDRWAATRTAWIAMAFFLRDVPVALYISLVIVPRVPNPAIGALFQYTEWAAYFAISVVLILIEQKIHAGNLRRDLLEAGFDRGIKDDIMSWRMIHELGRVEAVMFSTALMFIVSATYVLMNPAVMGWPDRPENYRLVVVFAGSTAAIVFLWLRQFRMRDYLVMKMGDYEREARWNLDQDIELHRMSSVGHMAGLIMHDLIDQVTTLKIATDSIAKPAHKGFDADDADDGYDGYDGRAEMNANLKSLKIATAHMEDLLHSLRAKMRGDPAMAATRSDLVNCVGYAITLLRASEGFLVVSKWSFKLDPGLRDVKIAMPQMDLVQVMTNLGSNAIRAMRDLDAGEISLELSDRDGRFVTVAMSDNGRGLSKSRFEQLTAVARLGDDSAQIREGLGLRLVCRMVERAGGRVSVDVKSGPRSTRIYVKLPLA
jgi:signal transduction histidine kinase